MINSKTKGKRGELEFCSKMKEYGFDVRRSVQYNGRTADGEADVLGLNGIHCEIKRVERLNIYEAMEQAERDSCGKEIPFHLNRPTVFHRKNNHPWLVTMRLEDWIEIYREWEAGNALEQE